MKKTSNRKKTSSLIQAFIPPDLMRRWKQSHEYRLNPGNSSAALRMFMDKHLPSLDEPNRAPHSAHKVTG